MPERVRIVHMVQGKTTEVEPWYQTAYSQEPVPSDWLSGWLKAYPNDSIHLPRANPFISSQFGLIDVSRPPLAVCLQDPHPPSRNAILMLYSIADNSIPVQRGAQDNGCIE